MSEAEFMQAMDEQADAHHRYREALNAVKPDHVEVYENSRSEAAHSQDELGERRDRAQEVEAARTNLDNADRKLKQLADNLENNPK